MKLKLTAFLFNYFQEKHHYFKLVILWYISILVVTQDNFQNEKNHITPQKNKRIKNQLKILKTDLKPDYLLSQKKAVRFISDSLLILNALIICRDLRYIPMFQSEFCIFYPMIPSTKWCSYIFQLE
jgi:hypothetical protein